MVFSDLFFIYIFIALCIPLYFVSKNIAYRNAVLVVFSLVFYAWSKVVWLLLLLVSVTGNYLCGLLIERRRGKRFAWLGVALSLVLSLGMLFIFKYTDFFIGNFNALFGTSLPLTGIELPIGISFYTFQILSYILDCYWGKVKVQRNYFHLLMYISLFPQLVAGPIVRYSTVEAEIGSRVSSYSDISDGITRFIFGLGKKVVLANGLYAIVEQFLGGALDKVSILGTWYGVILYSLYVYYDFSGYSDMAIGLGRIFGFHFDENFNYPFICKNITEFWQRWHISLGSFFRDYLLYLPIFGKRRQYASLFLVWFCTGFWHGASWNYIIWGLYYGLFILGERLLGSKRLKKIPAAVLHIYNKLVIVIGFGIFYFTDLSRLGTFFGNLVGANGNAFSDLSVQTSFVNNLFLILAAVVFSLPVIPTLRLKLQKTRLGENAVGVSTIVCNIAILLICSILLVENTNNPFLYWQF
ncbi:MAG: MBOAT family protein [Bacteroides sp.]|nr:MBOAT family protein [Eubacterium sp.]MCM1418746.1 MBOAT family protein [Roseburia sp.]MCM1461991.1 MBOAT family protein [Bacteroides sp.]